MQSRASQTCARNIQNAMVHGFAPRTAAETPQLASLQTQHRDRDAGHTVCQAVAQDAAPEQQKEQVRASS